MCARGSRRRDRFWRVRGRTLRTLWVSLSPALFPVPTSRRNADADAVHSQTGEQSSRAPDRSGCRGPSGSVSAQLRGARSPPRSGGTALTRLASTRTQQARSRKSKQPARSSHTQHSAASHSVDPPWTGDDPLSFVDLDAFPSYPDPAPTHPLAPPLFEPHHAGSHALPFPPDYPPLPALPPAPPAPEHSIDPRLLDPALDAPHSAHGPFDGFPALQHVARFNAAAALPPPSGAYAPRRRAEGERDAGRRVLRCLGAGAIRRGRGAGIGRW